MQWFSHIFTGLTRVILRAKNTENISERQFSGSPIHEKKSHLNCSHEKEK